MFNTLPKCGVKDAAPLAPILFPDHNTYRKLTHQHFHSTQNRIASTNLRDPTCACSTGCPSVAPMLQLHQHRCCSLITQQCTCHRTSLTNTPTIHTKQHNPCGAYVQGSTCACSTFFPSVGAALRLPHHRCCSLITQQASHEPTHQDSQYTQNATQPMRCGRSRFNVCMFSSFPKCGPDALAPSAPMEFPVHTAKRTRHMDTLTNAPTTHTN